MSTLATTRLDVVSETLGCGECGIAFAVPKKWVDDRRSDHTTWYCPNGHSRHFPGETAEQKRIKALEAAAKQAWEHAESATRSRDAARRSAAAMRGVLTRTKNRVAAGTCPCCDKHFKTLAKHMAAEHPDFTSTTEPGLLST